MAALLVRLVGFPLERLRFDGHEAEYIAAFQGAGWEASTRVMPTLAAFYEALGWVFESTWAPVGVNVVAGVVTVLAVAAWAERRWGFEAGVLAGALMVFSPEHAAWSLSAYNVAIPHAFLAVAICLGEREGPQKWAAIAAYGVACSIRMELMFLAPVVGLLGGWRTMAGAVGGLVGVAVMETAPALRPLSVVLPINVQLVGFLGPCVLAALLGASQRTAQLLGAALLVHIVGACFDDYGARHALLGGVALIGVVAGCDDRRRWFIWLFALGWSVVGTWNVADRFYVRDMPVPQLAPPPDCTPILDDPVAAGSHWDAWPDDPCWGEEFHHHAWTSRGLHDRATRMHTAYVLEPIGVEQLPGGPRVIYSVR